MNNWTTKESWCKASTLCGLKHEELGLSLPKIVVSSLTAWLDAALSVELFNSKRVIRQASKSSRSVEWPDRRRRLHQRGGGRTQSGIKLRWSWTGWLKSLVVVVTSYSDSLGEWADRLETTPMDPETRLRMMQVTRSKMQSAQTNCLPRTMVGRTGPRRFHRRRMRQRKLTNLDV